MSFLLRALMDCGSISYLFMLLVVIFVLLFFLVGIVEERFGENFKCSGRESWLTCKVLYYYFLLFYALGFVSLRNSAHPPSDIISEFLLHAHG